MDGQDTSFAYAGRALEINLHVSEELKFWCRVLGVTEHQLACAMSTVGQDAGDVRRHINQAMRTPR